MNPDIHYGVEIGALWLLMEPLTGTGRKNRPRVQWEARPARVLIEWLPQKENICCIVNAEFVELYILCITWPRDLSFWVLYKYYSFDQIHQNRFHTGKRMENYAGKGAHELHRVFAW